MATIRLVPSTYSVSSSYLSVESASNMYTNTDSTTSGIITNTRKSTSSYYLYLRGFNFSDIPANAVINSFTVKLKAYENGGSTGSSYVPRLVNNTSTISGSATAITTTVSVHTFTGVTATWETIKGYGNNFGIRINCRRASRNTQAKFWVYGAEILVDYTIPVDEDKVYFKDNGAWVEVSEVYKKINGTWVKQTDLTTVFSSSNKYIKG